MDEVLHFGLQTPPFELDGDQFVCTHVRTVCFLDVVLSKEETQDKEQLKKMNLKLLEFVNEEHEDERHFSII